MNKHIEKEYVCKQYISIIQINAKQIRNFYNMGGMESKHKLKQLFFFKASVLSTGSN